MAEDLTGRTFGYLQAIKRAPDHITPSGQKKVRWECKCQLCGRKTTVVAQDLKSGNTKSCGCLAAAKGKAARNVKICVICGKPFECPPSSKKITCSAECRRLRAKERQTGVTLSEQSRKKIAMAKIAENRDMSELQHIATEAAKRSPKSGRFMTNISAKDWHLISPEGKHYYCHSLNFWLRENCRELFGVEPDSQGFRNVASGLSGAKSVAEGKNRYLCATYKGWQAFPGVEGDTM